MRIAIGSDQWGYKFKEMIKETYSLSDYEFIDLGAYDEEGIDYPDIAGAVAKKVTAGECARGILICGTGIGMAIAANKVSGIYAAVCHDVYSTERAMLSNNANVMCMGALVIGPKTAISLVDMWLKLEFDPLSSSAKKVKMIIEMEKQYS